MSAKVTVQDIADALGLSRTTVSKVLNRSPAVSDATRTAVLEKAKELGYRIWNMPAPAAEETAENIEISQFALVMHAVPGGNHMGTVIIPCVDQKLRQEGFSLIACTVSDQDYETMQLPPILTHSQIKAILCLELFHPEYSKLLCSLGKPVLFIDACANFHQLNLDGDLLMMENRNSVSEMLTAIIRRHNVHSMGFVGDVNHCFSFRERYEAFLQTAMLEHVEQEAYCIIDDDSLFGSAKWLQKKLEAMENLPELFFCANDFLATVLIEALQAMGKRIPEDVMICGFDGTLSISWPSNPLTTVITPTSQLGIYAANILLRKVAHAEPSGSITYLRSTPEFRESAP